MNTLRGIVRPLACTAAAALIILCSSIAGAAELPSRYGGPVYNGAPTGDVTAELLALGGTPGNFSTVRALNALVGQDTVTSEVAQLKTQYGATAMDQFIKSFDFAVNDGWKRAGQDNVTFPAPATLSNRDLAVALITAGSADDQTFWTGVMLDKLLSHKVHLQVMDDLDAKYGEPADASCHKIGDQLFYDLAQYLGVKAEKLAIYH